MTLLWITLTFSIITAAGGSVFVVYQVRQLKEYEARQAEPLIAELEVYQVFEREIPTKYLSNESWELLLRIQIALVKGLMKIGSPKNTAVYEMPLRRLEKRLACFGERSNDERLSVIQTLAAGNVIRQNLKELGQTCVKLYQEDRITRNQLERIGKDINCAANQVLSEALLIEVKRKIENKDYASALEDVERYFSMHEGLSRHRNLERVKGVADDYFEKCQIKLGYKTDGRSMLTLG